MKIDPVARLLFEDEAMEVPVVDRRHADAVLRDLESLRTSIETPDPRGRGRARGLGLLSVYGHPLRLTDDLRALVETAARAVWEAKLDGKAHVEAGLLRHLAFTASPQSIRFFQDAIAFSRPRDTLIPQRQQWAVAGLAMCLRRSDTHEARAALEALLTHEAKRVRAWVVAALVRTHWEEGAPIDSRVVTLLTDVAIHDRAFEPRYLARYWLRFADQAVPCEPPDRVFAFKVSYGARVSRTIEIRSAQTLADLASAMVSAVHWDHDHLYQFRLGSEPDDPCLRWPRDDDDERDEPPFAIGAAGFEPRHRFTMIYDFGDMNVFRVEVVDVTGVADGRARYPRVSASSGKAPKQYAS